MSAPFISPTPWTHRDTGGAETVVDSHGRTVAILTRGMEPGNGAVIVAAPRMATAIEHVIREIEALSPESLKHGGAVPICDLLRVALPKADGP